ncbi:MAG: methionine adenosyltransferase [Euryarchaeota archaeon]|nr:methionine adenosyltransferase [Euryarchaeota archaeon]
MRNIIVSESRETPVGKQSIEMVERKGLGHPDFMADSIAEDFSRALCKDYLRRFGGLLHHNVDKLEVVGGETQPAFGGGKVIRPILIFFSGRATYRVNEEKIPLEEIAINAAKNWIRKNFRFLDPETNVRYLVETKGGAGNLTDVYKRQGSIGANDTSLGSGYAPLTITEKIVLNTEKMINSEEFKKEFPVTGEDVKIMGLRNKDKVILTIATSFIDRFVKDSNDYVRQKKEVIEKISEHVSSYGLEVEPCLNLLDKPERGINGCYLTVTGTSAEHGDDGAVGRGNRLNGLIPFNRPISMEASAGKNPLNHIGKIYNILAFRISDQIYQLGNIEEVYVRILSQIGKPINDPLLAAVDIILKNGKLSDIEKEVREIVDKNLDNITKLTQDIIEGKVEMF